MDRETCEDSHCGCDTCMAETEYQAIYESLSKTEKDEWETLVKKCPRCGGASANASNPSGRCSSCLKKLAANKKKVGHYLHEHRVADDALRRQAGKNGTASKKTRGTGTRQEIIDKVKRAEKKAGRTLSPDRKDNSKGYASSNVRMVPEKLNRGRHTVDPKKLAAWKKSLKKSNLGAEELFALVLAHLEEREDLKKSDNITYELLREALTRVVDGLTTETDPTD